MRMWRAVPLAMVAVISVTGCGGGEDGATVTTVTVTEDTSAGGAAADTSENTPSPEVEEFCRQARAVVRELRAIDDPASADAAETAQRAADLANSVSEINYSDPNTVDAVNRCYQPLFAAMEEAGVSSSITIPGLATP